MKKQILILTFLACAVSLFAGQCAECIEVAKGKIPSTYLSKSTKILPSGITIFDETEAMANLETPNILWVDTRPTSFFKAGTLKNSILLVYDQNEKPVAAVDAANALNEVRLMSAIKKVNADISKVKVAFFCQGPECHRSYNAALRAVSEYGLSAKNVIWFRAGYPDLLAHYQNDPKLKRKIPLVFKGDVVKVQ